MKLREISRQFEGRKDKQESGKDSSQDGKKELTIKVGDLREKYNVKDEVGRGKFGVVHKVIDKEDNCIYAAKFIKVTQAKRNDVFREIEIMKKLDHANLIKLTDVFDMQSRIVVIMEFISGGELFERVVEEDSLTESEAATYMRQILDGLQHMHQKNIVHLDLKPENVVCVEPKSTRIKLIDFGLARQLEHGRETKITCGTPEFVAPEVLNYDPVTLASDMWSVGVIAYILLSGLSPFLGDTDAETFASVSACEWDFDDECFDEVSSESKDFIEGLLLHRPRDRRTVDLCLEHDWIQNHSCKKRKKLRVENLRKFLAKKRWQRSVNAVRAVRRLSSFGASLLGKSGSPLRDRRGQSIESPELSIAEDCEGVNGEKEKEKVKVNQLGREEETETRPLANMSGDRKKTEQTHVLSEKVFVKKLSDNDPTRSLANISQLRQKFESMSDIPQPSTVHRDETLAFESRPRSNSLEWDYRGDELTDNNKKGVTSSRSSQKFKNYSEAASGHRDKGDFFKSRTIERSSRLVEKGSVSLGKFSRSTESLLTNGRPNRISLQNGGSAPRPNEQIPRSPVESLRDRKKLLNEGVLPTDKELNCSTAISNVCQSEESGSPDGGEDNGDLRHKISADFERRSSENLNVDSCTNREASSAMMKHTDRNNLQGRGRTEFDVDKTNTRFTKSRVSQGESRGNGKIETVRYKSVLSNRKSSVSERVGHFVSEDNLLPNRTTPQGRGSAGKGGYFEGNRLSVKTEISKDNTLTRSYIGLYSDSQATENRGGSFADNGQSQGYRGKGGVNSFVGQKKEVEINGKSNEPLFDDPARLRDVSGNNYNGESATDIAAAVRTIGSTAGKDSKSSSTGSSRETTNKQPIQSSLQDSTVESKQADFHSDYSMPHKRGWFKSSAAAKRASFRELLSKSIAAEDGDDDDDTGDEEPIHIEVKKEKFDDFFEIMEEIGRGRFGIVSKVMEKATGKFYAAKYIKVRAATRAIVRQEIELLCAVRHRRIVKLYDVFEESRRFILVLEWVAGGELFEKLSREEIISEKEAVFFVKQIMQGVRCMHKKGILHLDLKPENVMLVDPNSTDIKIIDFGLAKRYSPNEEIKVLSGTPAFAAPEIINFEKITTATDMWSIGVIAYVLMSGISPFAGDDNQETCSNVTKANWDFDEAIFDSVSAEAKDFISKLMVRNPRKRMSIEECMQHPWIKSAKKRKKSVIKTKNLFRFTKSFSKSVDLADHVPDESPPQMPLNNSKSSARSSDGDVHVDDEQDTRLSKQPVFQVINTMDESSSDTVSTPGILEKAKSKEEYKMLEDRYKSMERDYSNIKARLRKQIELQNEMEDLRNELEKSLQAHKKLQDSLLLHEEEKMKLSEAYEEMKSKVYKAEKQNQELLQKLDIVNENYEKLGRKYKRLQERLEKNEDLEDKIEELERTKARKIDKIKELEDLLSDVREKSRKTVKDDSIKVKLEKDNRSLQNTVEQCHQEIEELEDRLGSLEKENSKLQSQLKQLRNTNQVGNNNNIDDMIDEKLEKLEALRVDLEEQIAIEMRDKKLAEKERDTIEEEFAEERSNLECRIRNVMDHNKQLEDEIREVTALLDASKKSYFQLDEEYQDLKKDKSAEKRQHLLQIKLKEEEISELKREKESLVTECRRLDKKMAESIEEIKKLESEKSPGDGHSTIDKRPQNNTKELERVKEDLKMTQEHLRIATDTNSLLQLEVKKLKKEHETELNIQLIELEAKLSKAHGAEMDKIKTEHATLPNNERKELEDRITVQDFAIRKLQAILEAREDDEREKSDVQEIVPITMNGTRNSPPSESILSKVSLPDAINVTISPGNKVRVQPSVDNEEEDDNEDKDTLTDRELRRIAYKIADGTWHTMGQALCLRGSKYEEIMGSSYNEQEKIFRLLTLWRSEMKQPRSVMISQLVVAVERMKRREIVKFVKELNGREGGAGLSIRKRIRNFVR